MLEKICPEHNVPVKGESCSKEGCGEKTTIEFDLPERYKIKKPT